MQKWEYYRKKIYDFYNQADNKFYSNEDNTAPDLTSEGWELVTIYGEYAYFKRPLQEVEIDKSKQRPTPWRNPLTGSFKFGKKDIPNAWANSQAKKTAKNQSDDIQHWALCPNISHLQNPL